VPTPSEELDGIVARLEQAADRLKADAGPPPARDRAAAPLEPRAHREPPADHRRLDEVLDGLERANVEVQRARARLTELERRLGLRDAA
jgi:exonuclease VII small subunit